MRILIIFFIFLAILTGFFFFQERSFFIESDVVPVQQLENPNKQEPVKIILVGDIILDRGVEYKIQKEGKGDFFLDFQFPFLKIVDYLKKADIIFGNMEGPISDKGRKVGSIYSFRHNPEAINGLTFAGFNMLSFANNHAFDYTLDALEDNFLRLKAAGIDYVGGGFNTEEAFSPVIKEVKGVKVAFLAYTNLGTEYWKAKEAQGGIAWIDSNDLEKVKQDVAEAKSAADILIVSVHTGDEYTQNLTDFQKEFSKAVIDVGADLVVGHHPHVVQKSEQYNGKWIFYSLGNFIFDQDFSEETMRGQIVEIIVDNGKLKEVIPRQIKINSFFQPELIE